MGSTAFDVVTTGHCSGRDDQGIYGILRRFQAIDDYTETHKPMYWIGGRENV